MIQGIAFALAACFIWGLIFIVPQFMDGFAPIEIALGRYLIFGIISLGILCRERLQGLCRYALSVWGNALVFSLISTIGYYTCVVLALRYSTPAMCALILGISPITIAFYGNWKQHECSYQSLILPSLLIVLGLVIINAPHLQDSESPTQYILGLVCGLLALSAWSWYVVANARFLKKNPHVLSSDWSTLIGVSTLFWVALCSLLLGIFFAAEFEMHKYLTLSPSLINFLIGCSILGLFCSWIGSFLWNRASINLPVSLAGQLTIFETIFGVIFVYALEQRLPPQLECVGIAILLSAVAYGIRQASRLSPQQAMEIVE